MSELIAFVYRSGVIGFGKTIPGNALELIRGKASCLRKEVSTPARLAYDNKTILCPGVPEAESEADAIKALEKFRSWLEKCRAKEQSVEDWNRLHPKGTRVIVHSTVEDRACCAPGRTTTKARLSFGHLVVRVQHLGRNDWVRISTLTFPEGDAE